MLHVYNDFCLNNMFAYIFAVGFIIRSLKLTCDQCIEDVFCTVGPSEVTLLPSKNRGELIVPSTTIKNAARVTEVVSRRTIQEGLDKRSITLATLASLQNILDSRLHHNMQCSVHSVLVLREFVKRYVYMRLKHAATLVVPVTNIVRSHMNRLVIFSHI